MQGQGWVDSINLQVGMQIEAFAENRHLTVIALVDQQRTETTYNLEVDEFHTYFVGKMGAWVHNQGNCRDCGLDLNEHLDQMDRDGAFNPEYSYDSPSNKTSQQLGEWAEQKADEYWLGQGYQKIGGHGNKPQGIDGVYTNPCTGHNVVCEVKYNQSGYKRTTDGEKQMSDVWVDKRLDDAVGQEEAKRLRKEGFDKKEIRVTPEGDTIEKDITW